MKSHLLHLSSVFKYSLHCDAEGSLTLPKDSKSAMTSEKQNDFKHLALVILLESIT